MKNRSVPPQVRVVDLYADIVTFVPNCLLGDDDYSDLCSSMHSQDAIRLREYSGWEINM